jgi:hypothetical protein
VTRDGFDGPAGADMVICYTFLKEERCSS